MQGKDKPLVAPTKPGRANALRMERDGAAITVRFLGGNADKTQLRKIAESLAIAKDSLNTAQWFDASVAIPHYR